MEMRINGQVRQLDVAPHRTLLSVLREEFDLTGAKYGCGEGECGACTVLIDGSPVRSCVTNVAKADGAEVTTIEGLAENGELHPLQQAFIDQGAMQCGYCIPGMIMSAAGLLRADPNPSTSAILNHMDGNICRCGTYPRVIAAIRQASDALKGGGR